MQISLTYEIENNLCVCVFDYPIHLNGDYCRCTYFFEVQVNLFWYQGSYYYKQEIIFVVGVDEYIMEL